MCKKVLPRIEWKYNYGIDVLFNALRNLKYGNTSIDREKLDLFVSYSTVLEVILRKLPFTCALQDICSLPQGETLLDIFQHFCNFPSTNISAFNHVCADYYKKEKKKLLLLDEGITQPWPPFPFEVYILTVRNQSFAVGKTSSISDNIYIGKVAHITGAAENGPRYDPSLTPEQRRSIENGIYLCSNCADMIDKNEGLDYPPELLRKWKKDHEKWVKENLNKNPMKSLISGKNVKHAIIGALKNLKWQYINIPYGMLLVKLRERYNADEIRFAILELEGEDIISVYWPLTGMRDQDRKIENACLSLKS